MKRANMLYIIIILFCIVSGIIIGCIYRPLSEKQISREHKTIHYTLMLNTTNMMLSIKGSGTIDNHSQIRKIYDHEYDLVRTGYISMYEKESSLYGVINHRQQDMKGGSAKYKAIDKVLGTAMGKVVKIIDIQSFEEYTHDHQWPYEIWQRSKGNISLYISHYCHKTWRKRQDYKCSISGRITSPGESRPIHGHITITDIPTIQDTIPDTSQALSVEELLYSIR